MLRITQCTNTDRAKSYYSSADYYLDGQELPGVWRGKGAERLGLSGAVASEDWQRICDRQDPATGKSLYRRRKDYRTCGYDFNFHVPKSVSLLYAETQDERLLDAFRDAVGATMQDIESEAATRVRKQGQNEDRQTGNLIWGEFIHTTSRPVDGIPDPHLHAHCFVINATYDGEEQAWKAAQFRELKRDSPYFQALFHGRLARRLADLGLPIERTRSGWEVGPLNKKLLDKFSRRTAQIEAKAKELGITSPEAKSELGAKTRASKAKHLTLKELQAEWRSWLTDAESEQLQAVIGRLGGDAPPIDPAATQGAIEFALTHELERESVAAERRVLTTAMNRAVGEIPPEAILAAFPKVDLIRRTQHGRAYVTTHEVLAEEREIVAFAKRGRGACHPLGTQGYVFKRDWLNDSQRLAVRHVLTSRDKVISVEGKAGVGKTTLMQETVEAIKAGGTKVFAFAPSAAASRGVLRDEGFGEADTLKTLLVDRKVQEKAIGSVLWIDEAGLVGTRDMRDLFRLADELGARVLLTGDRYQHGSVGRGAVLRLLEEEAGIKPASVKEIQRQKGAYKEAVAHLSEGRTLEGFNALDRLGWVKEFDSETRHQTLAEDYAAAIKQGKTALIVAPTHAEGDRVTEAVRAKLKEADRLGKDEREFTTLQNAHLTEAERADPGAYEEGDVVQFFQNAKGHTRGDRVRVGGDRKPPVEHASRYSVFRSRAIQIAPGDLIRITHNGTTADGEHRLDNGAIYTVKGFEKGGNLRLANGWIIGREFGHFTHGYAVTSYASQGRTVDHVFIAEGEESLPAASNPQFYVSVSRARRSATIYTHDKAALREAIDRSDDRLTATEFVAKQRHDRERRKITEVAPPRDRDRSRELVHDR